MRQWTSDDRLLYEQTLRTAIAALGVAADAIEEIVATSRLWDDTATSGHNEDELRALSLCLAESEGRSGGWYYVGEGEHDYVRDALITLLNRGAPCSGCGEATSPLYGKSEGYMLHDELWQSITAPDERFLCVGCAEERLGRLLQPADFVAGANANPEDAQISDRLRDRLSAQTMKAT